MENRISLVALWNLWMQSSDADTVIGFKSQQTFGKSSLQSDEPGTQRESGWLHPYSILEATAKGDKIISAWRSSHDIDRLCRELMSLDWPSVDQKVRLMSSAIALKTEIWTKGFCQSIGDAAHALSVEVFGFFVQFYNTSKKRECKKWLFHEQVSSVGESQQRQHKSMG